MRPLIVLVFHLPEMAAEAYLDFVTAEQPLVSLAVQTALDLSMPQQITLQHCQQHLVSELGRL